MSEIDLYEEDAGFTIDAEEEFDEVVPLANSSYENDFTSNYKNYGYSIINSNGIINTSTDTFINKIGVAAYTIQTPLKIKSDNDSPKITVAIKGANTSSQIGVVIVLTPYLITELNSDTSLLPTKISSLTENNIKSIIKHSDSTDNIYYAYIDCQPHSSSGATNGYDTGYFCQWINFTKGTTNSVFELSARTNQNLSNNYLPNLGHNFGSNTPSINLSNNYYCSFIFINNDSTTATNTKVDSFYIKIDNFNVIKNLTLTNPTNTKLTGKIDAQTEYSISEISISDNWNIQLSSQDNLKILQGSTKNDTQYIKNVTFYLTPPTGETPPDQVKIGNSEPIGYGTNGAPITITLTANKHKIVQSELFQDTLEKSVTKGYIFKITNSDFKEKFDNINSISWYTTDSPSTWHFMNDSITINATTTVKLKYIDCEQGCYLDSSFSINSFQIKLIVENSSGSGASEDEVVKLINDAFAKCVQIPPLTGDNALSMNFCFPKTNGIRDSENILQTIHLYNGFFDAIYQDLATIMRALNSGVTIPSTRTTGLTGDGKTPTTSDSTGTTTE